MGLLSLFRIAATLFLVLWGFLLIGGSGLIFWGWLALVISGFATIQFWLARGQRGKARPPGPSGLSPYFSDFKSPRGLILIMAAGFIFNLFLIFANPQPLKHDALGYSRQGYAIAHNSYKADAIRTPGYPLLVAQVYSLIGGEDPLEDPVYGLVDRPNRNMVALWVVQSLLLSAIVFISYFLTAQVIAGSRKTEELDKRKLFTGKWFWGEKIPLGSAGLIAFCPFLATYTGTPQTEIYAAFWLTMTVFWWVKILRNPQNLTYYLLAGLGLALTLETRPSFLYFPVLVLGSFIFLGKGKWRLLGPLVSLAVLVLALLPPLYTNLRDWNEPTPLIAGDLSTYQTALGVLYVTWGNFPRYQKINAPAEPRISTEEKNRLRDYVPTQQSPDQNRRHLESNYWKKFFFNYVTGSPLEFGGVVFQRAWQQWNQHFVYPYYDPAYWDYHLITDNLNRLYLILALVGLAFSLFYKELRLISFPLYSSLFYLTALNTVVRVELRYTLPIYPLMLIFAAVGAFQVIRTGKFFFKKSPETISLKKKLFPLAPLGLAILLITGLSIIFPMVPTIRADQEKALDAVYISQEETQSCLFTLAQGALNRALAIDKNDPAVKKWQSQFPKELDYFLNLFTTRISKDEANSNYDNYRCRGDAYRATGNRELARADFQLYLQYAPPAARERSSIEAWLKELS